MSLELVKASDVPQLWDKVKPLVEAALRRYSAGHEPADVLRALIDGRMHLWALDDCRAICIAYFDRQPRRVVYVQWVISGTGIKDILGLEDVFADYARSHGAAVLQGCDSRVWKEKLPEWWKTQATIIERTL